MMSNKYYINDWENSTKDKILDDFEFEGDRSNIEILFASYTYEMYSGEAFLVVEKENKLYEVSAYHCSCYGLEGQFELEETTIEQLEHYLEKGRKFEYSYGRVSLKDQLVDFIKHYKGAHKMDKMNNYKVGDKVLYDGEVHTVIRVPVDGLTHEDAGYLDKERVVLDLYYDNAIHYKAIEPYFTPHERLLKLGWVFIDSDGTYKTYEKFDDKYTRRTMSIKINKDKDGWYFTTHNVYMDKELTTILLEYLEELVARTDEVFCQDCGQRLDWSEKK